MPSQSTRDRILNSAQLLAQLRGFNAFSYADIATELGVRKASIHYHFPSKHDLEAELLERYKGQFAAALSAIESSVEDSAEKLRRYAQMYAGTLSEGQICLGGMMASDIRSLPLQLALPLSSFFEGQIEWIAGVLEEGRSNGQLHFSGTAQSQASALLAALQGGLLMANAMGDEVLFERLVQTLLEGYQ